ncbi:MAG: hypothetical protein N3C12_14025 [Candidatus Binatia bacterium]|nr:hypothetical protein [Candidatus Binatia bacterium]
MKWIVVAVLVASVLAGGARIAGARWESERDSKSREELAQLDERGLFQEAFDVCVRRAALLAGKPSPQADSMLGAADDYLAVIEAVVRSKVGVIPSWLRELSFARTTKECQAVFRAFVSGETAPETRPAEGKPGAASSESVKKGPTISPRLGVLTQLPPRATATRTPVIKVPGFPVLWFTPTPVATPAPDSPGERSSRSKSSRGGKPPRQLGLEPATRRVKPTSAPPESFPPRQDEVTDELPPWFR